MITKKRVVITGIGVVSSIGLSVKDFWENLLQGKSGIKNIKDFYKTISDDNLQHFDFLKDSDLKYKTQCIGAVSDIDRFVNSIEDFKSSYKYDDQINISLSEWRKMGLFEKFALGASCDALLDSKIFNQYTNFYDKQRVGVCIGNGIGALDIIDSKTIEAYKYSSLDSTTSNGYLRQYGPMYIISTIPNLCASYISMAYNFQGPNYGVNAACASANMSICNSADIIRQGRADIVVCGGSERSISNSCIAGFDAMQALSRWSGKPEEASKPYHIERDGFVCADGAGIIVLEDLEHALKRKELLKQIGVDLKIYCEFLDYGVTSDAYHVSKPSEEGIMRAMQQAINHSNVALKDIVHVTAHGTSTPNGDECELKCIRKILDKDNNQQSNFEGCTISAIKSSVGHTLGASAGLQSVALAKSFEVGIAPPILNIDPAKSIDSKAKYSILNQPDTSKFDQTKCAMSNSFGFGGSNVVCIWRGYVD